MHTLTPLIQQLLTQGIISNGVLSAANSIAHQQKIPLIHYLVQQNLVTSAEVLTIAADFFHLPTHDLSSYNTEQFPPEYLTHPLIQQHYVLPLYQQQNCLILAMADPSDYQAIEDFTFVFNQPCIIHLVEAKKLYALIQQLLQQQQKLQLHTSLAQIAALEPQENLQRNEYQPDDVPVVAYIHQLLQDAVDQQISDIHCEPYAHYYRIRLRHDGILIDYASPPPHVAPRLVSRIKVMAELNIAEHRLPQDGRFAFITRQKKTLDVRVSTCPVIHGEKIVLRLLNTAHTQLKIEQLGLESSQQQQLLETLRRPHGLILVTGPTGSGKTITLYTLLQYLNEGERNICSAEDPVEMHLMGVNQLAIQPGIGLDFSQALRSFLRQDPDIIMVGEIRDLETALMACKAAQTGHLVLTTLHTQDAASCLLRLQQLGVEPAMLAHSLKLVIAQRLVRRLCTDCHSAAPLLKVAEPMLSVDACPHCYQGYRGRTGVFELLPINSALQSLMLQTNSRIKIMEYAEKQAWLNLQTAGQLKVMQGITTAAELKRVI